MRKAKYKNGDLVLLPRKYISHSYPQVVLIINMDYEKGDNDDMRYNRVYAFKDKRYSLFIDSELGEKINIKRTAQKT